MSNPLVANRSDTTTPLAGTFLLEDGESLVEAIKSKSWVAGGLAVASGVADTAAALSDPIGTLISMGLGWVLDHVQPFNNWLEQLTGDADQVRAHATTWKNVEKEMQCLADSMVSYTNTDLAHMSGAAVDSYRGASRDVSKALEGTGKWAGAIGTALEVTAFIVQFVHDFVRDAISQVAGSILSYAGELIASLGTAWPIVAEQISTRVASLIGKVSRNVKDLITSARNLIKKLGDLKKLFSSLAEKLKELFHGLSGHKGNQPKRGDPEINHGTYVDENRVPHISPNDTRPYLNPNSRPSFRKDVELKVWNNDVRPDGTVIDVAGRTVQWTVGTPRAGIWDMGHKPGHRYHDKWLEYVDGKLTPEEFRDWYNTPENYRVEHPTTNRSHKYE